MKDIYQYLNESDICFGDTRSDRPDTPEKARRASQHNMNVLLQNMGNVFPPLPPWNPELEDLKNET